jgi:four helix bundle protein
MKRYAREKLVVRKASRELVVDVFRVVDIFPQKIKLTLGIELKKAATALSSYITEGSSRADFDEGENLLLLAYECLVDISNKLILAKRLGAAPQQYFELLNLRIKDLAIKIDRVTKPDDQ